MTLYRYVRTNRDLVALMDDAIMAELLVPDDELPSDWRVAIAEIARRSRAAFGASSSSPRWWLPATWRRHSPASSP